MAITYIEIDTSLLQSDVNELNAKAAEAKRSLEALETELEELFGMWIGKASMAFRVQTNKDCNFMKGILSDIDELSECMTHAGKEYVRCENQVNELVNNIRI